MKLFRYFLLLLIATASLAALAQDLRTTDTRIADALALLPAKDASTAGMAFKEFIALDDAGLAKVIDGVRPSGDETGVPYRYAVALLAASATSSQDRSRIEKALIAAVSKSTPTEVRQYQVQYLGLLGTDRSVPALASLLNEPSLADPAIGALEAIGTEDALKALLSNLANKPATTKVRIVQALGARRYRPAVDALIPLVRSTDTALQRESLWALALIGDPATEVLLLERAAVVGYKTSPAQEVEALIQFMSIRSLAGGDNTQVRNAVLKFTLSADQQQYRIAALKDLVRSEPVTSQPTLVKELDRFDADYRRDMLEIAGLAAGQPKVRDAWDKLYKKSTDDRQAEILSMLAHANPDDAFVNRTVVPALDSKNPAVRIAALRALAATGKTVYADRVASVLVRSPVPPQERTEAEQAFLQLADSTQVQLLAGKLHQTKPEGVVSIVNILAARRVVLPPLVIEAIAFWPNPAARQAVYSGLPRIVSPASVQVLLGLLQQLSDPVEVAAVQKALAAIAGPETSESIRLAMTTQKTRLMPILPYLRDRQSLKTVRDSFERGQGEEKELAFSALANWQTGDAVPFLLSLLRDKLQSSYHEKAFKAFVGQVMNTEWPADQKLLMLREAFPLAASVDERKLILREAGGVRTFLSFIFVASLLDDPELGTTASRSAMRLAQPTADGQPGLDGMEVRKALEKVMGKLTGPDSQYDRIDVQSYLDQMPYTIGFEPLFNGRNLEGWQGLVENPIARAKMTKDELTKKQTVADSRLSESWSVKDGMICFTGTGDNLCTKRSFGDFELVVDWKISRNGDSGIYLRGSPQVQIWDTTRVDVGAQVGSGGLYNNTVNRNPLVVADNPIGQWNTLHISMIGERVTVYLNGILVVDNIVMENYWERKIPIFPEGAIELQAHGTELAFRNVYVRELNKPYKLTADEKQQGFEVLFNGNDLSGWVGNKIDYVVDDHVIATYPTGRGKGNLYTEKEFSDFVFRFEFQLTPAGNNGLGIHAPLEGDAAYVGKEIQILDDGHPTYSNIQPYQAHGSVYGVIAAKRGFLRPTGQWNSEEVEVRGDKIKVTLNGTVIVDGDMRKASQSGTLDKQVHPGLQRLKGHIGFLGHGSVVKFRNIRIRDIEVKK